MQTALIRVAMAVALGGLTLLFVLPYDGSVVTQKALLQSCVDGTVVIAGRVAAVTGKESFSIVDVTDASVFQVILFDNQSLQNGQHVRVRGRLHEFNGRPEIVADELAVW